MTRCEGHLGYYPNERQCGQTVGVRTWVDYFGDARAACSWHVRALRRRFGTMAEADRDRALMEATEMREDPDVPLAESELRAMWGDR
jgi:hypothetical protein